MTTERWAQIKEVFQSALDLPANERAEFVRRTCGADAELHAAVDDLLRSADADFLSDGALAYAPEAFQDSVWDRNIGRHIGAWVIERQIGQGGMGTVYLGRRASEFDQEAALKLLPSGMDSRGFVARFLQERQILAGLDHPNIARLLEGGATDDGQPYFAMEYIAGEPIDVYAEKHALDVRERLHLFQKTCAAVQYAHQKLIVHRDIKPGNILVTAEGVPKLLDFGIARLVNTDAAIESAGLTQAGVRLMTPEYASPEQVRGEPVTTATDVYSLGAVLYRLLTGGMPYDLSGRTAAETERIVCEQDPRAPSEASAIRQLRGDLDSIVLKALRKDSAQRYGSVEQLSADIGRYLEGSPIQARPQTFTYRTGRFLRRHRWPVTAAALVAISLAAGMAAAAREAQIARRQRARAEKHFNDVRQLANTFLFDFHDAIQNLPGSTPARQLVVQKALVYLNSLSQETANDSALERELVEAYLRVGDVQGGPGVSNLGDTAGALESYKRALAISHTAAQREPQSPEWQRLLARAETGLGDVLASRNDPSGALPHYRAAAQAFETMAPRIRDDVAAQFDRMNAWLALGDCLGNPGLPNVGDGPGAKAAYEKAREVIAGIAAAHPDNKRAHRNMGLLEMRIGDVETDSTAALARYQSASKILGDSVAQDPQNTRTLLILGNNAGKLASALDAAGQTAEALGQYRRASDIQQKLMTADPRNEQFRNSYAESLRAQAGFLAKTEDARAAVALNREALEIFRQLLAKDAQSPRRQVLYAETLADVGDAERSAAMHGEASGMLKSLSDRGSLTLPDLSWYAEHLLMCRLPQFADPAQAISAAQKAVEITHARQPLYLEQLARAYAASGNGQSAVSAEEKAVSLWPEASPQHARGLVLLARFGKAGQAIR